MAVLKLAVIFAMLSVVLGAFGAHGLKSKVSKEFLDIFQTGVHYQMFHALGMLFWGLLMQLKPQLPAWPAWVMAAGIVIFSGSLYILVLSGVRKWGAVTPIGGLLFIVAWILFFYCISTLKSL